MMTSASAVKRGAPSSTVIPPGLGRAHGSRAARPSRDAATALALEQYQSLLKRRLAKPLLDLFQQLTGLHLHVWWRKPRPEPPPSVLRKLCPQATQRRSARLLQICEECRRKVWPQEWSEFQAERQFDCPCGLTNFYACLKVQEQPVVTLLVQQTTPTSRAAKQAFSQAIGLTRLILHDLKATLEAEQAAVELETPRQASSENGSGITKPDKHSLNGNHRQQELVQRMLDYIHQHYSHPIELQDLAAAINLNASYVSSLFSATLGVTFHHYLQEFRLTRAKDLLLDPVKRVSEVAYAVGYSNPNHFRNVFTARVGLPPSAWRQTQVSRPPIHRAAGVKAPEREARGSNRAPREEG